MRERLLHLCIVGGGFTGAAAAVACLAEIKAPFRLTIVEPGASLGRGIAYGGQHPLHLLNVRTRDLSLRPSQPGDFLNWAFRQLDQGENHSGLHDGLAHTFLPRQLFGEYVRQRLFEAAEARSDVDFSVVNAVALACVAKHGRYQIHLDRAGPITADVVMLATAYGLQSEWAKEALAPYSALPGESFTKAKSIALIGSGLTMVDVLLTARREGFSGTFTIISRGGQWPRAHAPKGVVPLEDVLPHSKRASMLEGSIRLACEVAEAHGTPWQAVVNSLRAVAQDIWQGLSVEEQARFLRHLRPYWDSHRHRIPLEVHNAIQAEIDSGRSVFVRARATAVRREASGFRLSFKRRESPYEEVLRTDLAFDCTGHRPDVGSPLIRSLLAQGLARVDPHGLGLVVERDGQVLSQGGGSAPGLFALGPLGQGTLWEITAVPEIARQADAAARRVALLERPSHRSMALPA